MEPITLLFRNSRNAARDTPPFSARTVISASDCATTPSIRLWQILTSRAASPSPTYVAPAPNSSRYGRTASQASFGPDTTTVSLPASTTDGLPLTGAASRATPRASVSALTCADASGEIVEESTMIDGAASDLERRPFSPRTTALKSSGPATIVKTMSRSASSWGESSTVPPSSVSGSAFERVRLYTATSQPASSRRVASAYPMRPVPTQPSVLSLKSKSGICSPGSREPRPLPSLPIPGSVLQTFAQNGTGRAAEMSRAPGHGELTPGVAACNRLQHPSGEVTRDGTAHLRDDGRRLGGTRALRPPPRRAAGADLVTPRRVGAGRTALLRHDEHPLHHGHAHRHVGAGQAQPLLPPSPARPADHVGLRLGGPPPPALQPVVG